jgi:hypothetical protein
VGTRAATLIAIAAAVLTLSSCGDGTDEGTSSTAAEGAGSAEGAAVVPFEDVEFTLDLSGEDPSQDPQGALIEGIRQLYAQMGFAANVSQCIQRQLTALPSAAFDGLYPLDSDAKRQRIFELSAQASGPCIRGETQVVDPDATNEQVDRLRAFSGVQLANALSLSGDADAQAIECMKGQMTSLSDSELVAWTNSTAAEQMQQLRAWAVSCQ